MDATCSDCIDSPPKYAPYVNLLNGINTRDHRPYKKRANKKEINVNILMFLDERKKYKFTHLLYFYAR